MPKVNGMYAIESPSVATLTYRAIMNKEQNSTPPPNSKYNLDSKERLTEIFEGTLKEVEEKIQITL